MEDQQILLYIVL